jgi:hypothetical protein
MLPAAYSMALRQGFGWRYAVFRHEDNVIWQKMQHGTRALHNSAYNNRALLQEMQ